MAIQNKVLPFTAQNPNRQFDKAKAVRLIEEAHRVSIKHLKNAIHKMFDSADDTLFEMAEKAESNTEQSIYFDSMRIVRIKRKEIEDNYEQKIDSLFENVWRIQPEESVSDVDISCDDFELVGETDLEESLAITTLASKIKNQFSQELNALTKRTAHVLPQTILHEEINPLLPVNLCSAFSEATQTLDMDIKIKLILFKLYDQHIVSVIGSLYDEVNDIFIKAGILPKIKISIKNSGNRKTSTATGSSRQEAGSAQKRIEATNQQQDIIIDPTESDEILVSLQQLLSSAGAQVSSSERNKNYISTSINSDQGLSATAPLPSVSDVLTALTSMQHDMAPLTDINADQMSGQIRNGLFNNLTVQTGTSASHINKIDNDLIDIVSILFEYILEDESLPISVKGLVAKLQIPMLKVAMLNKDLFATKGHPARRLLNELAKAGLEVGDTATQDDSKLLDKIDHVVNRIINEFVDDVDLFSRLLDEFQEFFNTYQKEIAETVSANTHLQQKEELALAKSWVIETLNEALADKALPETVANIITGPWKDVMLHTYLNEGPDSVLWKNQLRFIDVLAWSLESKTIAADRTKLGRIIQHLVSTLKTGLLEIEFPFEKIEEIFSTLEPIHHASLKGASIEPDKEHLKEGRNQENESLMASIRKYDPDATFFLFDDSSVEENHIDENSEAEQTIKSEVEDAISLMEQQISSLTDIETILEDEAEDEFVCSEYDDKVIMEDIVLTGWDEQDDGGEEYPEDEYLDIARHLEAGKWLEFSDKNNNKTRARLAWKSDFLGEYTFMNWKFDVVADRTLNGLAADLRAGKARVIDDVPVLDRA